MLIIDYEHSTEINFHKWIHIRIKIRAKISLDETKRFLTFQSLYVHLWKKWRSKMLISNDWITNHEIKTLFMTMISHDYEYAPPTCNKFTHLLIHYFELNDDHPSLFFNPLYTLYKYHNCKPWLTIEDNKVL